MTDNRGSSFATVLLAFVGGGMAGAAVALLLAPQSGRESRAQLRGYARKAEENVHELAEQAAQVFEQAVDKGREFLHEKQAVLAEAVEAGRTVMQRERERLASEKKA